MGLHNLLVLDQQPGRAVPKGEPSRRTKGRKDRAEAKVKRSVRAACVVRDGQCRTLPSCSVNDRGDLVISTCDGPAEWAHMHAKRRSKTRGQSPEVRHDTAHSLMLCHFHHGEYDAKRLIITALTRQGADGPLKFRRAR